jgi:hypothetical protein
VKRVKTKTVVFGVIVRSCKTCDTEPWLWVHGSACFLFSLFFDSDLCNAHSGSIVSEQPEAKMKRRVRFDDFGGGSRVEF